MTRIIIALLAGALGIALTLAGLGIDAWLHAQDETLAAREGIFTLSNPGHALLAAGMALTSGGILSALYIAWGMSKAQGILGRRWVRLISMQAAGAAATGAVLFALAASVAGHAHTGETASAHTHDAGAVEAPAMVDTPPALAVDALAAAAPVDTHPHVDAATQGAAPAASTDAPMAMAEAPTMHAHTAPAAAPATDAPLVAASAPMTDEMHMHDESMAAGEASPMTADAPAMTLDAHTHPKPTAEELACLADLTAQAKAATTRFEDFSVAVAEGYVTNEFDPSKTHHPNRVYKRDGVIFDLSKPESLIYVTQDDGSKRFVGVLYHAPLGQGPTPCGATTFWHTHGTCIAADGTAIPESKDKTCPAGYEYRAGNVEMMHLWFVARGARG